MPIYILLMRSGTILSRIVHLFTGARYTHVAIGLSPNELYSMTRLDMRHILPAGLCREHEYSGYPHILLRLLVRDTQYIDIAHLLRVMHKNKLMYKFNILGMLFAWAGVCRERKNKYFCSEFCSHVLRKTGVYSFSKPDCLIKPMDFLSIPGVVVIDESKLSDLCLRLGNRTVIKSSS